MATVPAEITFSAGSVLTAAQLNTNLRDAVNFIIAPPLFIGRQTSGQSMAGSSYTAVNWDTEDIDRDGGHSTVTNTSRYTAQTQGYYEVQSTLSWPSSVGAGWVGTVFQVNGSSATRFARTGIGTVSQSLSTTSAGTIFLGVGDYLETLGIDGTSGNITLTTNSDGNPRTQVRWVST